MCSATKEGFYYYRKKGRPDIEIQLSLFSQPASILVKAVKDFRILHLTQAHSWAHQP